MQTPLFFIDTADVTYIKQTWEKLHQNNVQGFMFAGVTTNPSALAKVGCDTADKLAKLISELTKITNEIRRDTSGTVYIQMPYSHMPYEQIDKFAHGLFSYNGPARLGLKIPPYTDVLRYVTDNMLDSYVDINVTGISDAATAMKCLSYQSVRYVSIIPGRMEEVGIDADRHLNILAERNVEDRCVIAGSMRTFDGLARSIKYETIPTIGSKLFDSMTREQFEEFIPLWAQERAQPKYADSLVSVDERNHKLTVDFFKQMDELGRPLYTSLTSA